MAQEKFGEKLKQARLELKLTTKQVAEEIKIREDFLKEFEKSNWDFALPDVYKRGFLRTYAEFLHLDPDDILALLPPQGDTQLENGDDIATVSPSPHLDDANSGIVEPTNETSTINEQREDTLAKKIQEKLHSRYWQIGLLIATLAILALLFRSFFQGEREDPMESYLRQPPSEITAGEVLPDKTLSIIASENVQVLVRCKESKEKLFSGYMKKGTSQEISYNEALQISFSDGGAIVIRKDSGENLRPKKSGVGWLEITY